MLNAIVKLIGINSFIAISLIISIIIPISSCYSSNYNKKIQKDKNKNILIAGEYYQKGVKFKTDNISDSAYFYLIKAKEEFENSNDFLNLIKTNTALSEYYRSIYMLNNATRYANEAIRISYKNKLFIHLPYIYNRLAAIFFEKAVDNSKINSFYQDTTQLAIRFVDSSEYWSKKLNYSNYKISNYNILGACYKNLKMHDTAIYFLKEALTIALYKGATDELPMLYRNLGANYLTKGKYDIAISHANRGVAYSDSLHFNSGLWQNNYLLFNIYQEKKDYKNALLSLKKADSLQLVIYNENNAAHTREFEAKFKNKENSLLIKTQEAEIKQQSLRYYTTLTISLLSSLLLVAGIFFYYRIKNNNLKLERYNKELKLKQGKIDELTKYKDDMMSMLIHDLKNPLNAIVNLSVLNNAGNNSKNNEKIKATSLELINMINSIIDIKRMEETAITLNYSQVSINALIAQVISDFEVFVTSKNIKVVAAFSSEYTCNVDETLIKRAIANLFSNAIKFTPNNGTIEFQMEKDNDLLLLKICDTGPGISAKEIPLLFQKYSRAEIKNFEYVGSTGLGLVFTKMAINAHKGTVDVISEYGKGATFRIFLPLYSNKNICNVPTINQTSKTTDDFNLQITELKKILLQYNYYETSELLNAINNYKCTHLEYENWKQQMEDAILNSNREKINQMLNV